MKKQSIYYVFRDAELIGKAYSLDDVDNMVRCYMGTDAMKNSVSGKIENAKYWIVPVESYSTIVGANGEYNEQWRQYLQ